MGFIARRADPKAEFLASTDNSFRPVQFANAPDGNLYVIDMHRELIEGRMFLPAEVLEKVNAAGGDDRGRIYRIVPDEKTDSTRKPGAAKRMPGTATTVQLVAMLEHRNGWHRDTASRLLYQRQDKSAVGPLQEACDGITLSRRSHDGHVFARRARRVGRQDRAAHARRSMLPRCESMQSDWRKSDWRRQRRCGAK